MATANEIAAQTTRDQWQHYLDTFGQTEEELIQSIGSTEIVDRAKQTVADQTGSAAGTLERTRERYGMQNVPGAQLDQLERQMQLGDAANAAQTINTARLDQRDRNLSVASTMMQQGRGVAAAGMTGLGNAARNESNRNAANAQLKAQRQSQMWSTIGTLGSIAAFALF